MRGVLRPGQSFHKRLSLRSSFGWYDVTVEADTDRNFLRRLAGHVENGRDSASDPAFGTCPATTIIVMAWTTPRRVQIRDESAHDLGRDRRRKKRPRDAGLFPYQLIRASALAAEPSQRPSLPATQDDLQLFRLACRARRATLPCLGDDDGTCRPEIQADDPTTTVFMPNSADLASPTGTSCSLSPFCARPASYAKRTKIPSTSDRYDSTFSQMKGPSRPAHRFPRAIWVSPAKGTTIQ